MSNGNLSDFDDEMLRFLREVYTAIRAGSIAEDDFVGGMAQIMAALDTDNLGEAVAAFRDGAARLQPLDHF